MCLEAQESDDEDKVLVGGEGKLVEVVEAGDNLGAPVSKVVSTLDIDQFISETLEIHLEFTCEEFRTAKLAVRIASSVNTKIQ